MVTPQTDQPKHYSIFIQEATKRESISPHLRGESIMAKFELFIHRKADRMLEEKGLYQEIKETLKQVKTINHTEIQEAFAQKGWIKEHQICPLARWTWDACKDKAALSIELSLIDAVHRDFLRASLAKKHGDLDVLVYITQTYKEPKFHNIKRDIEILNDILSYPILLIGLT